MSEEEEENSWEWAKRLWGVDDSDDGLDLNLEEDAMYRANYGDQLAQEPETFPLSEDDIYDADSDKEEDYARWGAPVRPRGNVVVQPDPRGKYVMVSPGTHNKQLELFTSGDNDEAEESEERKEMEMESSDSVTSTLEVEESSDLTPRLMETDSSPVSPRYLGRYIQETWQEQLPPVFDADDYFRLSLDVLGVRNQRTLDAWKEVELETVIMAQPGHRDYERGRTVILLVSVPAGQYDRVWEFGLGIFALRLAAEVLAKESRVIAETVEDVKRALLAARNDAERQSIIHSWFLIQEEGSNALDIFRSTRSEETSFLLFIVGSGSLGDADNVDRIDHLLKVERQKNDDVSRRK